MKEIFEKYEALLQQKNMPCVGLLNPGIPKEEALQKIRGVFPSLEVDENFLALYEWHNGIKNYSDNYFASFIIPQFFLLDVETAVEWTENDSIYSWKEKGFFPILSADDEHLCIKIINNEISAEHPIYYFATWDYDSSFSVQIYDNLKLLFTSNHQCLEKDIINKDEDGHLFTENTMDEYFEMSQKANPHSDYWK